MPDLLRILAEPRRRDILRLVWGRELPAGDIHRAMPEVTFGAVSQHLKVLHGAGLVRRRRDGRHRRYRAQPAALGPLAEWLERMWSDSLTRLATLAESEGDGTSPPTVPQRRRRPRP